MSVGLRKHLDKLISTKIFTVVKGGCLQCSGIHPLLLRKFLTRIRFSFFNYADTGSVSKKENQQQFYPTNRTLDDFNDEHFHATGIEAILIFEGQICNCFTVPLSIDNSAYLSQLSKIAGEVNLQIFLNKINVWFDAVTLKKSSR